MGVLKWLLGAVVGGAVGALIWTTVAHFAHREVGWIAWGVGALTGLGVKLLSDRKLNAGSGVLAAIVALVSIGAAKYTAVSMDVDSMMRELETARSSAGDDVVIAHLADELATKQEERGEPVPWPEEVDEDAPLRATYPVDLWHQAERQWSDLSAEDRLALKAQVDDEHRETMASAGGWIRGIGFIASFGLFDILWAFLAATTAFKIASSNADRSAETADRPDESGMHPALRQGGGPSTGRADPGVAPGNPLSDVSAKRVA